ncbi:hypothetical protein HDU89_008655 [Geranomyces variabilis]|nr:hypothetical protein HDU89_008655 [Geranomyces variabilis]
MERWASIVRGYSITKRQTCLVVAAIWSAAPIVGIMLPLVAAAGKGTPNTPFVLESSGLYCLIDWADSSHAGRTQISLALCTIGATITALTGGYLLIWLHVRRVSFFRASGATFLGLFAELQF